MSYSVYRHVTPSGKIYVGITQQIPSKRWQHGFGYVDNQHFYRAIKKYGWDNIDHEILYTDLSADEAYEIEKRLISEYKSNDPNYGYNKSIGGESGNAGVKMSEDQKEKLAKINTGRVLTEETRRKLSESKKGVKFTEEHKKKISEALTGKPHKGHPHTPESIAKLKKSLTGRKNPHKGIPRSEECRKKISEANKGKPSHNMKSVICVETGEVFVSVTAAAKSVGAGQRNISACLCGKRHRAAGLHWKYAE